MIILKNQFFQLILFFMMFAYVINFYNKQNIDFIDKNKYVITGKVYKFSFNRSSTRVHYIYFYKKKKYDSSQLTDVFFNRDKYLDKYFEVIISRDEPSRSIINLKKEIPPLRKE